MRLLKRVRLEIIYVALLLAALAVVAGAPFDNGGGCC